MVGREGFGGVDVVPLLGANFCFISSSYIQGHQFHADAQENNNEFWLEFLADATLFSTLVTQKLVFAIWGLCWYNFQFSHLKCSHVTNIFKGVGEKPPTRYSLMCFCIPTNARIVRTTWCSVNSLRIFVSGPCGKWGESSRHGFIFGP